MSEQIFFGKYVVKDEIASGGMGTLYRALDQTLNRQVAIKVLHAHLSGDTGFAERFLREARAMARLDHNHIVRIYAVEEKEGSHYLVMEYYPGNNLRDQLKSHTTPLPLRTSLDIMIQLAEALAYAHHQGIIHRDIKPANILVNAQGKAKLTDFGIAAALDEMSLTSPGQILGTPEYMAPEQAKGEAIDVRTDLYSLGIVMYELVTARTPYREVPKTAILNQLFQGQEELSLEFPMSVPTIVRAIIEDLVRRRIEERTPNASTLVTQLRQALTALPPAEAQVATPFHETSESTQQVFSPTQPVSLDQPGIASSPTQPVPLESETLAKTQVRPTSKTPSTVIPPPSPPPRKKNSPYSAIVVGGIAGIILIIGSITLFFIASDNKPTTENVSGPNAIVAKKGTENSDEVSSHIREQQSVQAEENIKQQNIQAERERLAREQQLAANRTAELRAKEKKQAEEKLRQEQEQQKLLQEQKRLAQEQRLAKEQADREKLAREQALLQERFAKEKAERERLAIEQTELKFRFAKEQAERERLAKEQKEQERLAQEQRSAKEQADREKRAREQALLQERLAKEKAERERIAKEQAEMEVRLAKEQAERDRLAQKQRTLEQQLALEREKQERMKKDREEREQAALEAAKREQEKWEKRLAKESAKTEAPPQAKEMAEQKEQPVRIATAPSALQSQEKRTKELERKQLQELLETFKIAYEEKNLSKLQELSIMKSGRPEFLHMMFGKYSTINLSIFLSSISDQEAIATIQIKKLIDNDGNEVQPTPILRSTKVQIHREGNRWAKVEW